MRADDAGESLAEMKRSTVMIDFDAVGNSGGDVIVVRDENRLFESIARQRLVEHIKRGLAERGR